MILKNWRTCIVEAIDITRSLASEISPPALLQDNLNLLFEWLAEATLKRYGLQVAVDQAPTIHLKSPERRIVLYRSVRELLFNIVKHAKVNAARISLHRTNGGWLRIVVSDEGTGFNPRIYREPDRIPDGFGLSTVQQQLESIGAQLEIESELGKGSRMTILAPLSVDTSDMAWKRSPSGAKPTRDPDKIHILLVDDHAVMRDGLASVLATDTKLKIIGEAADGEDAVRKARGLHPDIVLMDIRMPRMDGIKATRMITAEAPGVKVIALSMHEDQAHRLLIKKAGAAAYLIKRVPATKLIATIQRIVQKERVQSRAEFK